LSDKDEIKELFQRELGNYEAKVDPSLWQGIQSGISAGTSAATTSMSVGAKFVIGIVSSAILATATIVIYNYYTPVSNEDQPNVKELIAEKEDTLNTETTIRDHIKTDKQRSIEVTEKDELDQKSVVEKNISPEKLLKTSDDIASETVIDSTDIKESFSSIDREKEVDKQPEKHKEQSNKYYKKEDIVKEAPVELLLKPIIVKQENQYLVFDIDDSNVNEIVWNFGDGDFSTKESPEHFYDEAGKYTVDVIGKKGDRKIKKSISVVVDVEGAINSLPNTFTPNGDGRNDYLFVETKGLKDFQINIMNNNQEVVYQSNQSNFQWDGIMLNGNPAPAGNYVYIIIATDNQGSTLNKYQQLHLIR
jgi:gliding motility-associated-like protein